MEWIRILASRCAALFRGKKLDAELDEELRTHIELATEENRRRGMNGQEARRTALCAFGGVTQTKERYRMRRELAILELLVLEIRYALRQLRKSPGFALTVVLTLALGVGSVTAVFSVVCAVLLRPYAFRDPGKLIVWRESVRELEAVNPLLPDNYRHYLNLKNRAHTLEDAAIVSTTGFSVSAGGDHPYMAEGLAISPNFFSVLGVNLELGRTFTPEETQKGREREVILTWGAWQRLFHGSPSALGSTVRVGDVPQTVVGILPRSFRFPVISIMPGQATHGSTERYEIFRPLVPMPNMLTANESDFNFLVIARLRPGVNVKQAESELDGIEKATAAAEHVTIHMSVVVEPFAQEITGDVRRPLWLLLAAVASVLLMACVNLANLQLARGAARARETALRAALGAGRVRLLASALMENLILGLAAGAAGVGVAVAGERLLLRLAATLPRLNEVHLSVPFLCAALGLSLLTSLGFGVLPAIRSLGVRPQSTLQAGSTQISGDRQAVRARKVLVTIEVAGSVTLLIVTALMTRSFSHLLTQDREFNAQHVVMAKASLSGTRYLTRNVIVDNQGADRDSLARDAMIDRTLDRLRDLPAVQAAAATSAMPLTGDINVDMIVRPDHPLPAGHAPLANLRSISPGYFDAMGIPLLSGRDFSLQDREHPRVAILSEKAARAAFPGENPVGRTITHWGRVYTIVGVAADARINDLKRDVPIFYLPFWDYPPIDTVFLVRSAQPAQALMAEMRDTIWSVDPDVSIPTVISLEAQVGESVATERFQAILLSGFGAGALLLAVLGIYGVLAYSVTQRTVEFGIRIALGENRAGLARLVLKDASYPVMGGIALGLMTAVAADEWIRSLLYQTSAADPLAIGLSLAVLLLAALAATLLPLWKAISVDPVRALRAE